MSIFEDGSYSCTPGIALIAKVLAGRCQMKYTRAAVGKGTIPEGESPKTMTQPAEYVMDAMISAITNPVNGECQVTVQINSADVESGFYATGILLYAEDPDEGEVPYTYLVLENGPEWIRPSSSIVGKLATFDLVAAVGDVDKVIATIDPNLFPTYEVVEQMIQRATVKRDIIIPTTGWATGAEESKEGDMYVDIIQEDVTEDMVPIISIFPAHADKAQECGMRTTSRTIPGGVRIYAAKEPATEIHAILILMQAYSGRSGTAGGGGTSADYVLPTATTTRLGGVKIGDNVNVAQDGTISVDGIELLDEAIATDDDVKEALDSVLGPKDNKD